MNNSLSYCFACILTLFTQWGCSCHVDREILETSSSKIVETLLAQDFGYGFLKQQNQRPFLLEAELDDREIAFIIDSGSSLTLIPNSFFKTTAEHQKTPFPYLMTHSGHLVTTRGVAHLPNLEFGNFNAKKLPATILNGNHDSSNQHTLPYAVIGADFLDNTSSILICSSGGVILSHPEGSDAKNLQKILIAQGYQSLPIHHNKRQKKYQIPFAINGQHGIATLDTGAQLSLFSKHILRKTPSKDKQVRSSRTLNDVSGTHLGVEFRDIHQFYLGNSKIETDTLAFFDCDKPRSRATIGQDLLLRHKSVIDFGNKTLYLLPLES